MTVIADISLAYSYIQFVMGSLIDETGWENTDFIFITEEVWRIMDITAEPTSTTDKFEYYALLKYKALEQFRRELATAYDYKTDGESFNRSQMFKHVSDMVMEAYIVAVQYLPEASDLAQDYIDLGFSPYKRST